MSPEIRRAPTIAPIILTGEITYTSAGNILKELKAAENNPSIKLIEMTVNSWGGGLYPSIGLYNELQAIGTIKPVRMIATGVCHSSALMLLQAATEERRIARPHTSFAIHHSLHSLGEDRRMHPDELHAYEQERKRLDELFITLTLQRSKMTREEFDGFITPNQIKFFSAEEALQFGFIDEILQR